MLFLDSADLIFVSQKNVAFVHVLDGLAFGFHKQGAPYTLKQARALLPKSVSIIGNCGFGVIISTLS